MRILRKGIWVNGYMGTWVYRYMVHGYMGIWVHGYMGMEYMGIGMGTWAYGCTDTGI